MRIIPFVVAAALSGTPLLAAPAQERQTCLIRGEVVAVSEREVARDPDWADAWGVPRTTRYTDVTIRPFEVSHLQDGFDPSCSGEVQAFQLGEGAAPEAGACVSATARFSGDEFRIGTWLTEIRPSDCD
jgi:hypothetical protein